MKILFSPLGDTDPIRGFHDGACLHIVRHYKPDKVVLFYTKDMENKGKDNHLYTYPIKQLAPHIEITEIFSGIEEPHLYDSFSHVLTDAVIKLHEKHPEAEILLNLSSATPAIKAVMAIFAVEYDAWCKGVQVATPMRASNRHNAPASESPDDLWETDLDNEPEAENRCIEPKLEIIRNYAERNRISSLLKKYNYAAALDIMRSNKSFAREAVNLTKFGALRLSLQSAQAKDLYKKYDGIQLFPLDKNAKAEKLVEYFLAMQVMQKQGRISDLLLRMTPFLDNCLKYYVEQNCAFDFNRCTEWRGKRQVFLSDKIRVVEPPLLNYLNRMYQQYFRDVSDVASRALIHIINYMTENARYLDEAKHEAMRAEIAKIESFRASRNENAHGLNYIGEREFFEALGVSSNEAVDIMMRMLCIIYGDVPRKMRDAYDRLNIWINTALA